MNVDQLTADAQSALGTSPLLPLTVGGQKSVFSAQLEGVPVVVKVVSIPETDHADEVLERARREVELLSRVESDRVVRVLTEVVELGDRPDAVCWVEERLTGSDLGDLIGSYPWSEDAVWVLLRDVADGLAACHALDVVHRDLSPGNLRRCDDGRFVIMDPGFARHLTKTALTGVYQPGTPGYVSPEHVPGGQPIPASDIFSLGILAFQALTGVLPILPTADEASYMRALKHGQAPKVLDVLPSADPDLAVIIDSCLDRQPARRYLDALELLDELPASGDSA